MKTLGICACIALCWISGFLSGAPATAEEAKKLNKPFRVIAIILMLFLILVLLCSCVIPAKAYDTNRFMLVEGYRDCNVYVDLQTGVEWIEKTPYTFAPAIDGYGRPMLWPGFDAMEDGAGRTEDADR